MYFGKKIEFKEEFSLSGKIAYELLISKAINNLNEYLNSGEVTGLGITGMRSPAFTFVGENSEKVFDLIMGYIKEIGDPYVDDVENTYVEPIFIKK